VRFVAEGEGPMNDDESRQRYMLRHVWREKREKLAREKASQLSAWQFALIWGGVIFAGTFAAGALGQVLIRHHFEPAYPLAFAAVAGLVSAALATLDRRARRQRRPIP
jgi:hypothetical protein